MHCTVHNYSGHLVSLHKFLCKMYRFRRKSSSFCTRCIEGRSFRLLGSCYHMVTVTVDEFLKVFEFLNWKPNVNKKWDRLGIKHFDRLSMNSLYSNCCYHELMMRVRPFMGWRSAKQSKLENTKKVPFQKVCLWLVLKRSLADSFGLIIRWK